MNLYAIYSIEADLDSFNAWSGLSVDRVRGHSARDALDRCIRGKGYCEQGVLDPSSVPGEVYTDIFHPDNWYFVACVRGSIHDTGLFKLDSSDKRRKYPKVVKVRAEVPQD